MYSMRIHLHGHMQMHLICVYIYVCVFMYRATSKQIEKCFQIVVDDIFTTYSQVSDRSFFLGLLYKDMHTHTYIYIYCI
jgi:hypothetical protein